MCHPPYITVLCHLVQAMNPFINAVAQIHPLISILETSLLGSSENEAGPGSGTATPAQWDVRTSTLKEIRRFSCIIEALWKTSYYTWRVASHASAVGTLAGWLGHEASSKRKLSLQSDVPPSMHGMLCCVKHAALVFSLRRHLYLGH